MIWCWCLKERTCCRMQAAEVTADVAMPLVLTWRFPRVLYALFRRRFGPLGSATAREVGARTVLERLETQPLQPTGDCTSLQQSCMLASSCKAIC